MEKNSILNVPLLHPSWKKLAYVFFPLPVFVVIGMAFLNPKIDPNETIQIIYGFWAIAFGILNLTREKVEDEMIRNLDSSLFRPAFIG